MAAIVQPMTYISSSSNMAYYTERGRTGNGEYIWASVTRNDFRRTSGGILIRRRVPTFSFTVHRNMRGQVAGFRYEPKTRPHGPVLPGRTVTGLVRAHLAALQRGEEPPS